MYEVTRNGRKALEADACAIGFLASRRGVPERRVLDLARDLTQQFDHRGAPGHGAGIQVDIPWPILLDRFPEHVRLIAQRDVALGMFFFPADATKRRRCIDVVEELADFAGARILQWEDVPVEPSVLPAGSAALRTLPVIRQALFQRPPSLGDAAWFACRYLLRLAIEDELSEMEDDGFYVASLSNRTVVYKGLVPLSRLFEFYPELGDEGFATKYALFHSRYCTNTTTAWRRAQPFWGIAHNGEITTIRGNVTWMNAIGRDLVARLVHDHPNLERIASKVRSVVCPNGSDTANLDDMVIALLAGGMTLPQALVSLLPEAPTLNRVVPGLEEFSRRMSVFLGACDGPAALVACDGDRAVAHLDRNGLRPLWVANSREFVVAASELPGNLDFGVEEERRILGPGDSVSVDLATGEVAFSEQVLEEVVRKPVPDLGDRLHVGGTLAASHQMEPVQLERLQRAFAMTREDLDVCLTPLFKSGKPAIGSMGDDTPIAAMLDHQPRRLEDYFALRFAQETSPPVDPIRDAWVFDATVHLGDRGGLWSAGSGPIYQFDHRVLAEGELAWLKAQPRVKVVSLTYPAAEGVEGLERALDNVVDEAAALVPRISVLVLSDRDVSADRAAVPALRAISRLHQRLSDLGVRHRVGIVADTGVWDIHPCALMITMGADAVCPWLGAATAGLAEGTFLKGLRTGVVEAMSMMGVTPSSAYCGARLVEAIGLDPEWMRTEFRDVPFHLGGIDARTVSEEWLGFHAAAFSEDAYALPDVGEFRHKKDGRPHANNAEVVRALHAASGYAKKIHGSAPGSQEAFDTYARLVAERPPVTVLDCVTFRPGNAIPLEDVEPEAAILWRFLAPGMSEGALSEPAHRAVARAFNVVHRFCRLEFRRLGLTPPGGSGPLANSGEGGFDKSRIGTRDGNASVQYAGGRFTITPGIAARAREAEVKFAQGAKPGKGGQLPGWKVSERVARQRGCEPGYELVSPPINHNLYSIEDVKLMVESWRHLNPDVFCALKYVATTGVEMVAMGGVNAGANRLHVSDGCGGTGAAKRVDQKHAGVPVSCVLPAVHDELLEEGVREFVEVSVDGGIQTGEQALKLILLGADRVGLGTSLLMAIGCSMLRKCHLAGPDPSDPTGQKRLGCTPGVATQDPALVSRFTGESRHIVRMLRFIAGEIRAKMAALGIRRLADVVGRRDLLVRREDLTGKAARLDLGTLTRAPHGRVGARRLEEQTLLHLPHRRDVEIDAVRAAMAGESVTVREALTNMDRCVGVGAAGEIAREHGDVGLTQGDLSFEHWGAAGHFYAAYALPGMEFRLHGVAADSCFTAAYGGTLVVLEPDGRTGMALVGNAFGYGARGGNVFIAGRAGNRFGICLRKNHEGGSARIVVEGVGANGFQYMTGGTALVLGPTGFNLGSGMTGGKVYLLDADPRCLNREYVSASALTESDAEEVRGLLREHRDATQSLIARELLERFNPTRFVKVATCAVPDAAVVPAAANPAVR